MKPLAFGVLVLAACGYTGAARVQTSTGVVEGRVVEASGRAAIALPDGRVIPLDTRGASRERRAGSRGAKYGAIGAGIVGLIAGLGLASSSDDAGLAIIGCSLGGLGAGAMGGAMFGSLFTIWEPVH